jgi:Ca2+-binding EF-hand superfamily protein
MFSRLDKDGDKKISEEEYNSIPEQFRQAPFSDLDANGDGQLDSAEQAEFARRMSERRRNQGAGGN